MRLGPSAPDHAPPAQRSGVACVRREARKRCSTSAVHGAQFWQVGQNAMRKHGADAWRGFTQTRAAPAWSSGSSS